MVQRNTPTEELIDVLIEENSKLREEVLENSKQLNRIESGIDNLRGDLVHANNRYLQVEKALQIIKLVVVVVSVSIAVLSVTFLPKIIDDIKEQKKMQILEGRV